MNDSFFAGPRATLVNDGDHDTRPPQTRTWSWFGRFAGAFRQLMLFTSGSKLHSAGFSSKFRHIRCHSSII